MTIITLTISDDLFQGYTVVLDIDYYDNNEQLCEQIITTLKNHLKLHNFETLFLKLIEKKFHIHDVTFGEICLMSQEQVVWVCSHCNYTHK